MSRVQELLVVAVVGLCAARAEASARRVAACDEDDGAMSLPVELMRSPLPEARPATDEPRLPDARVCIAGATDDASCRPHSSLPVPGQSFLSLISTTYIAASVPALPPADALRCPPTLEERVLLAAGFGRRVERPPRSLSVSV